MLPGLEVNLYLLLLIGLGAGVVSGFSGVGGGFFMTPALIILGFPANLAVGTSLAWVAGNCAAGAFTHGELGNVDIRLGLVMTTATISGIEVGVRVLNWAKDAGLANEGVLTIATGALLAVGAYTLREAIGRKRQLDRTQGPSPPLRPGAWLRLRGLALPPELYFSRSQVHISLWVALGIGFSVGALAGMMGVGGGFAMVPALIYLVGMPPSVAVGTNLFQATFSAAYGVVRHSMSANVAIFASFILLLASSVGLQFGAHVMRHVRGVSVRYVLGTCILLAAVGAALRLSGVLLGDGMAWSEVGSRVVIFGGLGVAVAMVAALFVVVVRHRNGQRIPAWARSLVSEPTD
jgi:hypothetical protein